jgi:predicted outer membrane lipoprotein
VTRPATWLDRWESAARRRVPGPVAFLVFGELRLFEAVWQLVRGRRDVRQDEVGIGYAKGRLPVELVFAFGALVELVAVDLLVPWELLGSFAWLRLVVLLASAYGIIWIALWMVAERTRPHLATDDALVLRWGHLPIATVPWGLIAEVRERKRYSADEPRLTHDVPLQGTNVDIELLAPMDARIPFKRRHRQVTGISLGVDDPTRAVEVIRARLLPR